MDNEKIKVLVVDDEAEIRKIIEHAHQVAIDTITQYKDKVTLIAKVLMEKETITAEEINYLMEHDSLEEEKVESVEVEQENQEQVNND